MRAIGAEHCSAPCRSAASAGSPAPAPGTGAGPDRAHQGLSELRERLIADRPELVHLIRRHGIARRHLAMLEHGIDMASALPQLVVQVRSGRESGRADAADDLPLRDAFAGTNAGTERGEVEVRALVSAGVADPHRAPAATRP